VNYVDAGYAIGLSVLFLYALSLVARRRRLERRVEVSEGGIEDGGKAAPEP
jgi:uncharacterized membrane protein YecN with MAPEG domain